ncbi:hypothetical protein OG563_34815 [Nocardia vinacea]|uniref:Uncharacterized protein n=1 Tax=Nocardia vinacea TaxID=96468 RepID=A0ABZ1YM47_9NOCA|nr:hypothetical protein [Nocardia vinacea]
MTSTTSWAAFSTHPTDMWSAQGITEAGPGRGSTAVGKASKNRGLVLRASIGTAALELHASEKPGEVFQYAEDGRLITGLDTTDSFARTGGDPHRFDTEMRVLGARPEEDEYGPLGSLGMFYRLAENLGVGVPLDDLNNRPVLSGRLLPPASR